MKYYTANKISQFLDISVITLNNWYRWYNNPEYKKPEGTPFLPPYKQDHPRGTRYWSEEHLYDLRKFKEWIPRGGAGVMGDSNAIRWGERGRRALRNKQLAREAAERNERTQSTRSMQNT